MMKIVINCATTDFLGKCLESVIAQSMCDWEAFVTLDGFDRSDRDRIVKAAPADPRIYWTYNKDRKYSLSNQISSIRRSGIDPQDVIISLDGDDWFACEDALQIISQAYQDGAWMTYGSWVSPPESQWGPGSWPAYLDGCLDFRNHRWLATAVRTWKRWLWDRIKDSSLRDDSGRYFRIAEDRAIMYPLLEMCGTERAQHIAEPIMFYNQQSTYSADLTQETEHNVALLKHRPPYSRIVHQPRWGGELSTMRILKQLRPQVAIDMEDLCLSWS